VAKWAIFCDWCSGQDIDPVRVTVQQLTDFLVYLFEIKQLVPSTIDEETLALDVPLSPWTETEDLVWKEVSAAWHKTEAEVLETMLVLARLVQ
jgi:hypothetical protein